MSLLPGAGEGGSRMSLLPGAGEGGSRMSLLPAREKVAEGRMRGSDPPSHAGRTRRVPSPASARRPLPAPGEVTTACPFSPAREKVAAACPFSPTREKVAEGRMRGSGHCRGPACAFNSPRVENPLPHLGGYGSWGIVRPGTSPGARRTLPGESHKSARGRRPDDSACEFERVDPPDNWTAERRGPVPTRRDRCVGPRRFPRLARPVAVTGRCRVPIFASGKRAIRDRRQDPGTNGGRSRS